MREGWRRQGPKSSAALIGRSCHNAEATHHKLSDLVVSDKALVTGYHFPFPAVSTIVPDGAGYTFVPAA